MIKNMQKQTIKSNQMQNGKWQSSFLPTQGPTMFTEPYEFDIYFDTKEEADKYTFDYLQSQGFNKDNIEIK